MLQIIRNSVRVPLFNLKIYFNRIKYFIYVKKTIQKDYQQKKIIKMLILHV